MNSTENLKRQWDAAKAKLGTEREKEKAARDKYHAALCADLLDGFAAMGGVIGVTRVRVPHWSNGTPDTRHGPFFVVGAEVRWSEPRFVLAKIKKDGTASNAPSGQSPERVLILPEDNQ